MKILHILAQLPHGTGSGIYFSNLIKELEEYGHEQRAVFALQDDCCFQRLPADRQYAVNFKTEKLPFPVPGMSDVMPYESSKYCEMSPQTMERWHGAFRETLEKAAADFQPDVLILHHLWILSSLALEIFPQARSIGICHHTDLRQARQNPHIREEHVGNIHKLDIILSLSEAQQADIREIHSCQNPKIVVMGGGFDDTLFFPAPDKPRPGPPRILYAGKIDPSKGVFALIEAFSSLRRQDPELRLSIVGAAGRDQAERLDKLLAAEPGIQLYPAMSQPELARTMREHDIFVLPSFFEGLGLIAIEALASGLWTVATEIEGLVSLLGDRVIQSGAIEFVPLPVLDFAGLPPAPQLKAFVHDLETKLARQAARARRGEAFPPGLPEDISRHSWKAIAARINALINA